MKTVAEYLHHAEECMVLSRRAKTPQEREMILEMAATWRRLANERVQYIRTQELIAGWSETDRAIEQLKAKRATG